MEGTREGHPLIVAAGGDGTLSEVANGILAVTGSDTPAGEAEPHSNDASEEPVLALINMGTGGDFQRSLGIGSGYEESLQAIALGRERPVDIGRASFVGTDGKPVDHYFVNVLSAGLGGLVDRYMDKVPSFLGGQVAYYLASLRAVAVGKERSFVARVTWEEKTREEVIPAYLIAICNGRWFGGGMDVAPMALPDDGRFEVLTITERSRAHIAVKIRKVYSGHHLELPSVHHFPCHRIELRMADEALNARVLLDVDGEPLGSLPLVVEVLPSRLRIRA